MGTLSTADTTAARRIIQVAREARQKRERRQHRAVILWHYAPTIALAAMALCALIAALLGVRK